MNKIKLVPLTRGEFALVDAEDFARVSKYKWHLGHGKYSRYARRNHYEKGAGYKQKRILWLMHRFVLGFPDAEAVDHINGDGLDNRKANLRLCTNSENCRNQKISKNNTTGFKGVFRSKNAYRKWCSYIRVDRKWHFLGSFCDKRSAALAYNNAAEKYHGKFAKLNELRGVLRDERD